MSEGPIKRERDAWKPPVVSSGTRALTAHARSSVPFRAYCGRKAGPNVVIGPPESADCSDCRAAIAADAEAAGS